jgi:hypothetical protein
MLKVLESFFGCAHRHTTFPITPVRSAKGQNAAAKRGTYITCLDCGKEFAYDWSMMRIVAEEKSIQKNVIPVKVNPALSRIARFGGVLVEKMAAFK